MAEQTCARCGGRGETGFLLELRHGNQKAATRWVEGVPERTWLGGVMLHGKRQLAVQSWRCTRCGLLESYAPG